MKSIHLGCLIAPCFGIDFAIHHPLAQAIPRQWHALLPLFSEELGHRFVAHLALFRAGIAITKRFQIAGTKLVALTIMLVSCMPDSGSGP